MPADRPGPVAGIVLAAGKSSRMGRNKLFFVLEGETVLSRAVRQAAGAGLDPVIVVLGYEADRGRMELAGLPCLSVLNKNYDREISFSLRTGLAAVPAEAVAAVVMLADMPFVTTDMLTRLIHSYRKGSAPLVISDFDGVNAPPMLYDRSLFQELELMEGEGCGRQVVRRHRSEAVSVGFPASALTDLDVPEDYERVKAQLAVR